MSMNVTLPPELEDRVRQRVESGKYGSASEVIREALNLFEAYEDVRTAKLDNLRQDIAKGLSDAQNGRTKEIDFASLKQQGRQILKDRLMPRISFTLSAETDLLELWVTMG